MGAIHNQIQTYAGVTPGQPVVATPVDGPGGRGTPAVSLEQSQSTPAANVTAVPGVKAPSSLGIGAPSDDGTVWITNTSGVNQALNNAASPTRPIVPQPNVLDQYASYTYSLSWYLVTPTQYKTLLNQSGKLNTNQWSLLAQSGGASAQTTSVNTTTVTAASTGTTTYYGPAGTTSPASGTTGRNKYFSLDYYIDDLEITSNLQGSAATSTTEISFKLMEPNGITLLANLNSAIRDLISQPVATWQNVHFIMTIRFYGYDEQGNLITNIGVPSDVTGTTQNNSTAVIVKYIPFIITALTFSAANKGIEYHIKGAPAQYVMPLGSGLGSIPYNLELTGETVDGVLNGQVVKPGATATDGIVTTLTPPGKTGTLSPLVTIPSASPYGLQVNPLSSLGITLNNING